jgi:hypothetical protein
MFGSKGAEKDARVLAGEPELIDNKANNFGIESGGRAQIRGNCCLILDAEKLVSVMWIPRRTLEVPRSSFRSVEITRKHLGKIVAFRLVKLHFVNEDGADDSVAWFVRDREAWESALEAAIEAAS